MAKHNSRVEWASQAGGSSVTKSGKVVEIVLAQRSAVAVGDANGIDLRAAKSRDRTGSVISSRDRYLVEVTSINGVKLKKPAYYAPTVALVDRQAAERKQAKNATSGPGIAKAVAKGVKKAFGSKVSATSKQGKITVTAKKPVAKKARRKAKDVIVSGGKLSANGAAQATEHAFKAVKQNGSFRPIKLGSTAKKGKAAA